MNNLSPYLILFGGCCLMPVLMFVAGMYLGRNGMPFRIVRNGRRASRGRQYSVEQ